VTSGGHERYDCLFDFIRARWASLTNSQGLKKVYLFGAGKHTDRLLATIRNEPGPKIIGILDDQAAAGQTKGGAPVMRPEAAVVSSCDAIVLSTDTFQDIFSTRCRTVFGVTIPLIDLYSSTQKSRSHLPTIAASNDCGKETTVAICIHKRITQLPELVRCLANQRNAPPFETLFILNASPEETVKAVNDATRGYHGRFRLIEEPRTGLSYARNRAIEECRTPWLAFIDDDAVPHPGWLAALVGEACRVGAVVAGGKTVLRWDFERPRWFEAKYDHWLSFKDFGPVTRRLAGNEFVVGANVLYRTSIFSDGLRFDTRLGRIGDNLISDEETILNNTIKDKGYDIFYIGTAVVDHIVSPERTNPEWMTKRAFDQGRSYRLRYLAVPSETNLNAEKKRRLPLFWSSLKDFLLDSVANSHPGWEDYVRAAGFAWEHFSRLDAAEVPSAGVNDMHLMKLAEDWGRKQFDFFFSHQIAKFPAGYTVAIVGAGITGKWIYDLCAKAGVQVAAMLDDYLKEQLTPAPVVPINYLARLKMDAVILATLRNEKLLRNLLVKAGYSGTVISQAKPAHKDVLTSFAFSRSVKPLDGLPGRDWPLNVQLQTASACNARCLICPYSSSWHKQNPGMMDAKLLEKILADLEQYHLGKLCIYLQNEPLCDKRWLDIARDAIKRLKFDRFEISTNASLLKPKSADILCSLLKDIPHEVWISFQGADRESYERIMGLELDQTLNNMEYFLKLAAREELTVRVHGFGIPRHASGKATILFNHEQYNAFLNRFADERGIPRFPVRFLQYHDRAGHLTDPAFNSYIHRDSLKDFYCPRLDTWLHVLYTGEPIVCCNDYHREAVLGDLRSQTIREYFRSQKYRTFRDMALGLLPSEADFICKRCSCVGG